MSRPFVPPVGWGAAKGVVPRVLHIFPTFAIGGSQRRFAAIANHFGPAFRHLIWPLDGCADAQSLLEPEAPCDIVTVGFPKQGLIRNIFEVRRLLGQLRPDVMVTYNWGAIEWAAGNITGMVRHVHIEDGFSPEEATRQLPRRVWFRRLVLNRHSTVVLPSQKLVAIATNTWRLDSDRLIYLPNAIPSQRFGCPPDLEFVSMLPRGVPIIGTVATLRREKSLDRLIDACAALRATHPCHLVIVGDGPERAALEKKVLVDGLTDDVTFTGSISQPERILGVFDVFAVSSDTEQMPLSILEAMAAGRAIASTDAGDIRNMLAAENRPFVVPLTVSALRTALAGLLDDAGLREHLGAANHAKAAAEFDENAMFSAYGRLFGGG